MKRNDHQYNVVRTTTVVDLGKVPKDPPLFSISGRKKNRSLRVKIFQILTQFLIQPCLPSPPPSFVDWSLFVCIFCCRCCCLFYVYFTANFFLYQYPFGKAQALLIVYHRDNQPKGHMCYDCTTYRQGTFVLKTMSIEFVRIR